MATGVLRRGPVRWLVFGLGWVFVVLGSIGIVVPGLPTTGFFVLAASCFTRSSPRFEAWVLGLPGIGPMVRDYRDGLGMPRRAKVVAIGCMVLFAGGAAVFALEGFARWFVVALAGVGVWFVGLHVPTRERVLEAAITPAAGAGTPAAGAGDSH